MFWYDLPWDIRVEILQHLAQASTYEKRSLSNYASVAREWQPVFEKVSFKRLVITPSELGMFQAVFDVIRRRQCLQHIAYRLEFPRHRLADDDHVGGFGDENLFLQMRLISRTGEGANDTLSRLPQQQKEIDEAFTTSLRALFLELSSWKTDECLKGFELEIVADTESDWQKNATRIRRTYPMRFTGETRDSVPATSDTTVIRYSPNTWHNTLRAAELDFVFFLRLALEPGNMLSPMVHVVSSLSILRKSIRQFSPRAIAHIISRLPNLRKLIWEIRPYCHWRAEYAFYQALEETGQLWPASIEMVRIRQTPTSRPPNVLEPSHSLTAFSLNLSMKCQHLTTLSIEHGINAFNLLTRPDILQNIQYLSFKSEERVLGEVPRASNHLFGNASKALNFPFSVSNMLFLVGLWETLTMIAVYLQTSTTMNSDRRSSHRPVWVVVFREAIPLIRRPERGGWPGCPPMAEEWVFARLERLDPGLRRFSVPARVAVRCWFPGVRARNDLSRAGRLAQRNRDMAVLSRARARAREFVALRNEINPGPLSQTEEEEEEDDFLVPRR
ncbi:hypothetical protein FOXG_10065 [Fusarium oxysporum f. sp. lycopersici 4287]|uniref:F-box domain-containing protein n=2 Tax=Fusarium oxysporum TaxID=5507 RepID=A0A0J9VDM7_FUSO4|nr:hypothetical protein FOXG_10065 [Fusarium oxysporum f. sp. lycopersici 4287]KNB09499.1 hypothetical protein FOXG_10065 [Fusarium oxysporum f. sp. lycopersici 4287]